MSPQKFVKTLPPGWTETTPPQGNLGLWYEGIRSIPIGFALIIRDAIARTKEQHIYTPNKQIAIRLPDGRLVIPTVKGEKGQ